MKKVMKKNDFCFAKWLTNRDIEKILEENGMALNDELPTPINRFVDDEGKTNILVKAKMLDNAQSDMLKKVASDMLKKVASYMAFGLGFGNYDSNNIMLMIDDFFMMECLSLKTDRDEEIAFDRELTKNYQKYMLNKFGTFYKYKKAAYIKKLNKIQKAQENEEEPIE